MRNNIEKYSPDSFTNVETVLSRHAKDYNLSIARSDPSVSVSFDEERG